MEPGEYSTLFAFEDRFWWYRSLHRLVLEWIDRSQPGHAPAPRILDAGCGTGGMLSRLGDRGSAFGLDFSPIALTHARRRGLDRLSRSTVTALPYPDRSFDLIISLDVLYHRDVASDLSALEEFRRCLRPGGRVILNLPAFESLRSEHDQAIHTARRYRREPLRSLLIEAGLQPIRISYWNSLLFPALALVRLMKRSRGRTQPGDSRRDGTEPTARSDVRSLPGPLNHLLTSILSLERRWLARCDLPFGLSLLALAVRPEEDR